jgi:hypothetical protein
LGNEMSNMPTSGNLTGVDVHAWQVDKFGFVIFIYFILYLWWFSFIFSEYKKWESQLTFNIW